MTRSYRSFKELVGEELENRDYRVRVNSRNGPVLVMAPHGGKIEPGTAEVAEAIAGTDHSFYSFEGIKTEGNNVLHIESHLFDEPCALKAVGKADIVITVHGQLDQKEAFVMVGGLNGRLRSEINHRLEESGFLIRPPAEGLGGTDPMNICNRGRSKCGVQLEISRKVRDSLRADKERLQAFAEAVRKAIRIFLITKPA